MLYVFFYLIFFSCDIVILDISNGSCGNAFDITHRSYLKHTPPNNDIASIT